MRFLRVHSYAFIICATKAIHQWKQDTNFFSLKSNFVKMVPNYTFQKGRMAFPVCIYQPLAYEHQCFSWTKRKRGLSYWMKTRAPPSMDICKEKYKEGQSRKNAHTKITHLKMDLINIFTQ